MQADGGMAQGSGKPLLPADGKGFEVRDNHGDSDGSDIQLLTAAWLTRR